MRPPAPLRRLAPLLAAAVLAAACAAPRATAPGATAPGAALPGWTLVWADEFDGPAGAPADPARWVADTGGGGWGNEERQHYTAGANAALDGEGRLAIAARAVPADSLGARRCWYGPCRYTSARLKTQGRFEQAYGRFEARLRVPRGQGIWPAFWMLGRDIPTAGWPASGELDVMEHIGREPRVAYGTAHGPGYSGAGGISRADTLPGGAGYADAFHVFAVEWEPGEVRWLVDGRPYHRLRPADLPAGGRWVYDHPFFLLLNLAVGGRWPGDPDATTTFPQTLLVDYVRVYRR